MRGSKAMILGALLSAIAPFNVQTEQVIVAVDESGSMQDKQQSIKENIDHLFNELNSPSGLTKPQIGLVGYGAGLKFAQNAYTVTPMTNDSTTFRNALETLHINGANEWGYKLAVEVATNKIRGHSLGLDLDPSRGFCLLLISDEPFDQDKNFARTDVEAAFAATGGVFFGVGEITEDDMTLAANTGGEVVSIVDFQVDPSGVIDALIAKCKNALPPEEPSQYGTLGSLLCETSNLVDETLGVLNGVSGVVDVIVNGANTLIDLSTGSVTFSTQNLVDKLMLTITTMLDGVNCLVHHTTETVDDILAKVIVNVDVILDDVTVELTETLVYVDGILDKTTMEIKFIATSTNFLLHSIFKLADGVVYKVSETLEGTVADVTGLLVNVLGHVDDILTTTVTLIEGNVDDLEDSVKDKLSEIADIVDLIKTIFCGGSKNIVEVVGGTLEWLTVDLVDKVVFITDALLDTAKISLTNTIQKVDGLLAEIIVLVEATLADVVITLQQTIEYIDGVLDKIVYEAVATDLSGEILINSIFEDVNDIVTAISEVIGGTADDVKDLLGNGLVEVDGLLRLILSTVNDNVDELMNSLITDEDKEIILSLAAKYIELLGLGRLIDGTLLGGLGAGLDLCPCFGANDLLSIEACIELENLNYLNFVGVKACTDVVSLENALTSESLVAKVNVGLNGVFQCGLSVEQNRRNLRQRKLQLGNVVGEVVNVVGDTIDTVVDGVDDTINTVVDIVDDTVDTVVGTVVNLISALTFDEYNSCLSLLLQQCQQVPRCS